LCRLCSRGGSCPIPARGPDRADVYPRR
jgi:hypothetical protein